MAFQYALPIKLTNPPDNPLKVDGDVVKINDTVLIEGGVINKELLPSLTTDDIPEIDASKISGLNLEGNMRYCGMYHRNSGFSTIDDLLNYSGYELNKGDVYSFNDLEDEGKVAVYNGSYFDILKELPQVDEDYNPSSFNAQSGRAVAQALATISSSSSSDEDMFKFVSYDVENNYFLFNTSPSDYIPEEAYPKTGGVLYVLLENIDDHYVHSEGISTQYWFNDMPPSCLWFKIIIKANKENAIMLVNGDQEGGVERWNEKTNTVCEGENSGIYTKTETGRIFVGTVYNYVTEPNATTPAGTCRIVDIKPVFANAYMPLTEM